MLSDTTRELFGIRTADFYRPVQRLSQFAASRFRIIREARVGVAHASLWNTRVDCWNLWPAASRLDWSATRNRIVYAGPASSPSQKKENGPSTPRGSGADWVM